MIEPKGEIVESTIVIEDFNNSLSEKDRFNRQKISKHTVELNNTINQLDIMNIYTLFIQQQLNTHFFQARMEHLPR